MTDLVARGTVRAWLIVRVRSRCLDRRKAPRHARRAALDGELLGDLVEPAAPSSSLRAALLAAVAGPGPDAAAHRSGPRWPLPTPPRKDERS